MPRPSIKQILMQRDGLSATEADQEIKEAKKQFQLYLAEGHSEAAYNICEQYFGLEPDYLIEFI